MARMAAKKKRSSSDTFRTALWRRRRLLGGLAALIAAAGLLGTTAYAMNSARLVLRDFALAQSSKSVQAPPSPNWLKVDIVQPVQDSLNRDLSRHPAPTAQHVAQMFEKSSWIRQARVRRSKQGFYADLDFRRPLLAVAWNDRCCYVDADGVALDADTLALPAVAHCMTLEGIEARGLPRVGCVLPEPSVPAAARLAQQIGELRTLLQLDRMHVGTNRNSNRPEFMLISQSGARIVWGDAQIQSERKLQRLRDLLATGKPLESGQLVDLR